MRRRRGARSRRAETGQVTVEVTRATVIDASPLGELDAADAWLARATGDDSERIAAEALAVLNQAVAGHRVAAADPWVADADPARALVIRVGYGTGEQVADGDWESARELPVPATRAERSALLSPQERRRRAARRPRRRARLRGARPARPRRSRPRPPARGRAPACDRPGCGAGRARGVARDRGHGRAAGGAGGLAGGCGRRGRRRAQGGLSPPIPLPSPRRWGGSRPRCALAWSSWGGTVRLNCAFRKRNPGVRYVCLPGGRVRNTPPPSLPLNAAVDIRLERREHRRQLLLHVAVEPARRRTRSNGVSLRVTTAIRPPACSVSSGSPATG